MAENTEVKFTQEEIQSIKDTVKMGNIINILPKEQIKTILYQQLISKDVNITEEWIEANILN